MIQVQDGMKLRRLTRHIGLFGFQQGEVYTFKKNPFHAGSFVAEGGNSQTIRSSVPETDWEVVNTSAPAPKEPTSIFIVVGLDQGNMSYGVFFEEKKAITYLAEKDKTDVYRFYENGETQSLTPLFIDGKLRLVDSEDIVFETEEETE